MRTATNDEITQAVDMMRAMTRTSTHLPDRATTRQLIVELSGALLLEENEMLCRLADYHKRNLEALVASAKARNDS